MTGLGVGDQRCAGRQLEAAVMFSPAVRPVTSASMLSGSFVASASMATVLSWWLGMVGVGLTDDDDRDLDRRLLAAADE